MKKYIECAKRNGNIFTTCKQCSDKKYKAFIENKGLDKLMNVIENAKEVFIKARFVEKSKVEHMWVRVNKLVEEQNSILIEGILDNDPVLISNIKYGDIVKVALDDISNFIVNDKPFMDLV